MTTILIVDDDKLTRQTLSLALEDHYETVTAKDGKAALEIIRTREIDLILSDLFMPGMNGKALFDIVATIFPDARVVFMSGYSQEVISEHGVLLENIDFLQKPFTVRQLVALVREVLDRGRA